MKLAEQSGAHSYCGMLGSEECTAPDDLSQMYKSGWYFNRKEIESNSPSRKDGIDLRKERQLRMLYCSFLQDVGMRLGVPQVTIATAMMFCHRFYLHQSHARNDWQTIATVCIFLASKVEDTPILLEKVIIVAYEMIHRKDPAAFRIRQKEVFEKQKALIVLGERLVLSTIRFDFNIQHPYKSLIQAMNKFGMTQKGVRQTAWNFVNDWLRTTLCLQYKPHYIAAGSLFVTAKLHNVKLRSERGYVWWHEFDVTPHQLDVVIQEMMELLGSKRRSVAAPAPQKPAPAQIPLPVREEEASSSPDSCVLSRPGSDHGISGHDLGGDVGGSRPVVSVDHSSSNCCNLGDKHVHVTGRIEEPQCRLGDPENPDGVVDNGEISRTVLGQGRMQIDQAQEGLGKINLEKIKELIKKKKRVQEISKRTVTMNDGSEDAWIERELEAGIELASVSSKKKQKLS